MIIFGIVTTDAETLFPALYLSPKDSGEVLFGDGSCHPLTALLEDVGGQGVVRQL
jgi:hypothetical protein